MSTIQVTIAPRVKTSTVLRTGATGIKGDKGDQGEVGPQGPQGIQGIQGERGLTGLTGPQGPQGIQGERGFTGDTGPQGPQGIKGDTGSTGPAGATGPQGPKGDTGATGPQGPKGDTGDQGPAGPQGPQGIQGPAGAAGSDASVTSANITTALGYTPDNPSASRTPTAHKSSHATGGSDALTASDIGAAAASHTHPLSALTQSAATSGQVATWNGTEWVPATPTGSNDASQLTTGTLADARLSSNVSLDNINNNFTAGQTITASANTSALTASYSVTGTNTTPLIDLTGTWNTTGVARGLLLNITDTASNGSSRLFDLVINGTSRVNFTKAGQLSLSSNGTGFAGIRHVGFNLVLTAATNVDIAQVSNNGTGAGILINSTNSYMWTSGAVAGTSPDLFLSRDSAHTLAQRNGSNLQTARLYASFTDLSNYVRLSQISASDRFRLAVEAAGTGSLRPLEFTSFSSASDPTTSNITSGSFGVWKNTGSGVVKLWINDAGTMKSVTLA